MIQSVVRSLLLIALGLIPCVPTFCKDIPELEKLADGIYARIVSPDSSSVSNSGIIILDRCVLLCDTHFTPEGGRSLLDSVRSVTGKPVRYVVNSHAHADHTHGNQIFPEAFIIGSARARSDMVEGDQFALKRTIGITQNQLKKLKRELTGKKAGSEEARQIGAQIESLDDSLQSMQRLQIVLPDITLDDSLTIRDGKETVRIFSPGPGHTEGDVLVLLESLKIAFVGDLFFNEAIPNVQDAPILQWMKTLDTLLKLDVEKFVPGHGKVGSKKEVAAFLAYLEELKSLVRPAVDRGEDLEQVLEGVQLPAKYSTYLFQNLFPANIQKMYAELKALQASAAPGGKSKSSKIINNQ